MKLYEVQDNRLLFVFSNQEMKRIKRGILPLDCRVAKDNRQVVFSFMTEDNYPKKMKEFIELQAQKKIEKMHSDVKEHQEQEKESGTENTQTK